MALGRHKNERQQKLWIATTDLPRSEGHVFYRKLNLLLREVRFDTFVETLCEPYYHDTHGRTGIPPGVYFRMLLVGYFEGIGSQRGIAWRCGNSLSLREFLGIPLTEDTPDHSSVGDQINYPAGVQIICLMGSHSQSGALRAGSAAC